MNPKPGFRMAWPPTTKDVPPAPADGVLPFYSQPASPRVRRPIRKYLFITVLLGTFFLFYQAVSEPACPPNVKTSSRLAPSGNPAYLIEARHGAVASENRQCSEVGVDILKEGGNAVDAIIATTFCMGVLNPFASGIGGGGIMVVRIPPTAPDSKSSVYTIDFREAAPALANETMYQHDPMSARVGGKAVAVPGEVLGLEEAHKRWGRMPWNKLVQPSVELARGWLVSEELAKRTAWVSDLMLKNKDWSPIFAPEGVLLKPGDLIRRVNYSSTLEKIASKGSKAFYQGRIAEAIVQKVQATGGILTLADLTNYTVKVRRALEGTYRKRKVYTAHAPSSGPALLHMLNLVNLFDLGAGMNVLNVHRIVEIMNFGFAARTNVSDPALINDTTRIDQIHDPAFAKLVFPRLDDAHAHPPEYYRPVFDVVADHGTAHTSVVDKDGMAAALTSTINLLFGSQVLDPETGIILNDEMDDFSTPGVPNAFGLYPSPYNYPEPGKRPLSSTAPTIIENEDGSFHLAIGGSGGSRIFPAVFQVILNLGWGMDVSEAVEHARVHDQLYPTHVDAEHWYPRHILRGLKELGHNLTTAGPSALSEVQVVLRQDGKIFATSDSRKNGVAAGY